MTAESSAAFALREAEELMVALNRHGTAEAMPPWEMRSASYKEGAFAERKSRLGFMTARGFALRTPAHTEWVVEPYVPLGGVTKIDGPPKRAGKTTFVCHIVAAILTGESFLGGATKRGAVVMVSEQGGSSFREALEGAGLLEADDFYLTTIRHTAHLPWPEIVAEAVAFAKQVGAVLLIVDTLPAVAQVRGDDENSSGRALEIMEPLLIAADEHQIGVLVTFHDRKSGGEVGESGRGSSAYAGAVDVILQLTRPGGRGKPTVRKLAAESRYAATPRELFIELTGHGYVSLGSAADVARAAVTAALVDVLPTTEDAAITLAGATKGEEIIEPGLLQELAAREINVSRPTLDKEVKRWIAAGYVGKTGTGGKGGAFRFWLITEPPPAFLAANAHPPFAQRNAQAEPVHTALHGAREGEEEMRSANAGSLKLAESNGLPLAPETATIWEAGEPGDDRWTR